jgi:hypothetical protein
MAQRMMSRSTPKLQNELSELIEQRGFDNSGHYKIESFGVFTVAISEGLIRFS